MHAPDTKPPHCQPSEATATSTAYGRWAGRWRGICRRLQQMQWRRSRRSSACRRRRALRQVRQPARALLVAAKGVDCVHDQRALHAAEAAQRAVPALQLLQRRGPGHGKCRTACKTPWVLSLLFSRADVHFLRCPKQLGQAGPKQQASCLKAPSARSNTSSPQCSTMHAALIMTCSCAPCPVQHASRVQRGLSGGRSTVRAQGQACRQRACMTSP